VRDFSKAKRIVIKIGTNILTKNDSVDAGYVRRVAGQVNSLLKTGRQVVIISSGAIGMGLGHQNAPGVRGYRPAAADGRVPKIVSALRRNRRAGPVDRRSSRQQEHVPEPSPFD